MPIYAYFCPDNGRTVEVAHSMREDLTTWAEVCDRSGADLGETSADAAVERILFRPGLSMPAGDAALKQMGFTKLVRRDKGVYENVTALDHEKKLVTSDDASSLPDFKARGLD